ncbi:MAG: hypothetical protein V4726_08265 [Verrucomicrobiota bacterium]
MLELRQSGLVEQGMGRLYRLVPGLRPAPGAEFLDLGVCLIRLRPPASAAKLTVTQPEGESPMAAF